MAYRCPVASMLFVKKAISQMVKNLPSMQETWVGKIPLEKEVAAHSSALVWRIPWTKEPGGLLSMELQRVSRTGLSD